MSPLVETCVSIDKVQSIVKRIPVRVLIPNTALEFPQITTYQPYLKPESRSAAHQNICAVWSTLGRLPIAEEK